MLGGVIMNIWILTKQSETDYENARLIQEFAELNMKTTLVHPNKFNIVLDHSGKGAVKYDNRPVELPDGVLIRTGSGTDFHSLTVLRELENRNVLCINTSTATVIAKDKMLSGQLLSCHGISIPKTMMVRFPIQDVHLYAKEIAEEIGFPCILKVNTGSFGHGVHLCRLEEEFLSLIQLIQTIAPNSQILLQKFISTKIGSDLRVWIIGGKAIGVMERKGADGDFRANISNGGVGSRYELNDKIIDISEKAATYLNLDIAGVDLLFDGEDFTVCEVNSSPGFFGFEKYCETNIAKAIAEHINSLLEGKDINKNQTGQFGALAPDLD